MRQLGEIHYYALKTGKEIDFIMNNETAFEVKETPTQSDLKYLEKLAANIGLKMYRLIGRYPSPNFENYIWGGEIR